MGTTVNLIEVWEPYKAAKAALSNILQTANIKQISQKYFESLKVKRELTAENYFERNARLIYIYIYIYLQFFAQYFLDIISYRFKTTKGRSTE